MVRFEGVSKAYLGGRQALQRVTFHLRLGEMLFLIGCSGSGKSTLLKLIYGIERLSTGKIWFNSYDISHLKNRELPFLRRQIGMIFQDHYLLMDHTVFENVAIRLIISGAKKYDIRRRVLSALDTVGLLKKEKNFPPQLSKAEQRFLGIARAVVNNPSILLADEPMGDLDKAFSMRVMHLFEKFNRIGITILLATQHVELIPHSSFYRLLRLNNGHLYEAM